VYWGQLASALRQVYPSLAVKDESVTIESTHDIVQVINGDEVSTSLFFRETEKEMT
jgi:hypothetical protein